MRTAVKSNWGNTIYADRNIKNPHLVFFFNNQVYAERI